MQRNNTALLTLVGTLCSFPGCDVAERPSGDAFRLVSEQPEDEVPDEMPDPTDQQMVCAPFDGRCVTRYNADEVIDLEGEGALLLFVRPCLDDGEAIDGCVDLEVALSNGNVANYTLVDSTCTGEALRPLGPWQPGDPLPGSSGKPVVQTSSGFSAAYRDPACFGGYIALERQLFRAVSSLENADHNHLGIPAKVDRTQVSTLEIQTPDHWIDNVGNVGHFRYDGFVEVEGDPWANPVSDDPDDGWHTVLTLETTQHTAIDGGEVCAGHWATMVDHDGNVVDQPDPYYECALASSGSSANPYTQQCKAAVNEKYPKSAVANVGFTFMTGICEGTVTTETSFGAGGHLGTSGSAGNSATAEGQVEGRVNNTSTVTTKGACASAADELHTLAIGPYREELEKCLANPAQYLGLENPIVIIVRGSQPAQTVGEEAGVAPLWSCDLENGSTGVFTVCEVIGDEQCCTEQIRENKNCVESGMMQCSCEPGALIEEKTEVCTSG